jgi:hypothetical protein
MEYMIKCDECGSDNVYAHREVIEVYRIADKTEDNIVLEDNPKQVVEDTISFYCHDCNNEVVLERDGYQSIVFQHERTEILNNTDTIN